jgi:hypothetical protein
MDVFIAEEVEHGNFSGLHSHATTREHGFGSISQSHRSLREYAVSGVTASASLVPQDVQLRFSPRYLRVFGMSIYNRLQVMAILVLS